GRVIGEVLGPEEYGRNRAYIERALAGEVVSYELDYMGRERFIRFIHTPLGANAGRLGGFVGVAYDVTEQKLKELELVNAARVDPLTGALNRAGFEHAFEKLSESPGAGYVALLYVDLDRFKAINDTYGHPAGDRLLKAFAQRLMHITRPGDVAARLGGDEFAVILTNVKRREYAEMFAQKVIAAAQTPFCFDSIELCVGASIGIAVASSGNLNRLQLIERADASLYDAKRAGRGQYVAVAGSVFAGLGENPSHGFLDPITRFDTTAMGLG
ncbi:MAG TPA: diguanylate cyclase, partial [Opitutaceae bacterium]|nr:diguanylate cyclase [Opitutaceae bacterium]